MRYHAQIGQDIWIAECALPGRRGGHFVDVGAYDGDRFSNTLTLERDLGWTGICIEAEPGAAARLAAARTCRTFCALLDCEERDRWFMADRGMLNYTIDEDGQPPPDGAVRLRTRTLASILEEACVPEQVDYLTVDIEGAEAAVLAGFPFGRRYGAMTVEVHANRPEAGALLEMFHDAGYVRVGALFSDWFFLPAGAGAEEGGHQAWLENDVLRRVNPGYWNKPEVAHVPWIQELKCHERPPAQ